MDLHGLIEVKHTREHLLHLLELIVDGDTEISLRESASIHCANFIAKYWQFKYFGDENEIITPSDKVVVREKILEYVSQVPSTLRVHMGECLKIMIFSDYPNKWPGLLDWVTKNLQDQKAYGPLLVLQILTSTNNKLESLEEYALIQNETFPHLLKTFEKLVNEENPSLEVADHIKLICKIFWSCIRRDLPSPLFDRDVLSAWLVLFLNVLDRHVPLEDQPKDLELRSSWVWWKIKKWVARILNSALTRFGVVELVKEDNKDLVEMFKENNYAEKIIECNMKLLNAIRVNEYLHDQVIYIILQSFGIIVSKDSMYEILKPRVDVLLFEIVFPLMCFNNNDQKLWGQDKDDFVKKGYGIFGALYGPKSSSRYDEAPLDDKPYGLKDGALYAFGTLSEELMGDDNYKYELENMLVKYVFPEFNNTFGDLRAKATWVVGQYARIDFIDQNNLIMALKHVIFGLRDKEHYARAYSVLALRLLIVASENLFMLMNESESHDIVLTLKSIVQKFGEEISSYALLLCKNLASAISKRVETNNGDDNSDSFVVVGCLHAITLVLDSIDKRPDLYGDIEQELLPIMQKMLTIEDHDMLQEVMEIVSCITSYSPTISLEMWSLWPLMMNALVDWASDYFSNMLMPMHNYISRGTKHFLTCKEPDYQQSLFDVISVLLKKIDIDEDDKNIVPVPKLLGSVLQSCKGQVDHWVKPYLKITLDRLQSEEDTTYLKCFFMKVVANAFYYNATLALDTLQDIGNVEEILTQWLLMLQEKNENGLSVNFNKEDDKKVCILGLTSILNLPNDQLPNEMSPRVYKALLDLLVAYKDQLAEAAKAQEFVGHGDGDDDDEDDIDDDDDEYLYDSDSDFSDEDLDSPIDEVDPFIFFNDALIAMQESNMAGFKSLNEKLDSHYKELAENIAQYTEERKIEIMEE
ncbi:unnamed protein product [Cochlearia groenlandica]